MGEKTSNPRAAQVRVESRKSSAYSGQRNHDLRRGPQPSYVDEARIADNDTVLEPPSAPALRAINQARRERRNTRRAMRSDASVAFVGILTFGRDAQVMFNALSLDKQREAFEDAARAVAERLNTTLVGLVIHRDETAPHAHFTLPAYDLAGNPLTSTIKRATLQDLQTITAEAFQKYAPAIERGRSVAERREAGATYAEILHRSVRQLHEDLPAEIAAKQAEAAEAMARVAEMTARVRKLEDKAELTSKEAKRLETYRARLAERVAVEEAARLEAERLAAVAREEAAEAAQDRDAARTEEEASRARASRITSAIQVLAEEIRDETIGRNDSGKVVAHNPVGLKQGFPDLKPAVFATADVMAEKRKVEADAVADRKKAAEALKQAQEARTEMFKLRDIMRKTLSVLKMTLKAVGKHMSVEDKDEADVVVKSVEALISAEEPRKDPPGSDGPGF